MFIATSNNLSAIQPALRDRMEVIKMSGYTIEEKVEIARQHLFPKQLAAHGLTSKELTIGKKTTRKKLSKAIPENRACVVWKPRLHK